MKGAGREADVIDRLVQWANSQSLVRALLLESSRASDRAPIDILSDYVICQSNCAVCQDICHEALRREPDHVCLILWPSISQGQSNIWKRLFHWSANISGHFTWQKITPEHSLFPATHVRAGASI